MPGRPRTSSWTRSGPSTTGSPWSGQSAPFLQQSARQEGNQILVLNTAEEGGQAQTFGNGDSRGQKGKKTLNEFTVDPRKVRKLLGDAGQETVMNLTSCHFAHRGVAVCS